MVSSVASDFNPYSNLSYSKQDSWHIDIVVMLADRGRMIEE